MSVVSDITDFGSSWFDGGLITFLIRAAIYWGIAKLAVRLINRGAKQLTKRTGSGETTAARFLHNVVSTIIYVVAVFVILSGVKPLANIGKAALGATSILTVVVGLAAQETFGNFIAGFFLAITHPFQVGDLITLPEKNLSGTVVEITMRHTVLKTFEKSRIIIPNSVMNTAVIEDRAFNDNDTHYEKWITVGVAYDADLDLAQKLIREAVMENPKFMDTRSEEEKRAGAPAVKVRVEEFEASDVLLKFMVASRNVDESLLMCSQIRQSILKKFAENGVVIPYQTISVISDSGKN